MPEPDLTALFLRPLEGAGLDRYMVSGSIASIEYGEPRATLDVDELDHSLLERAVTELRLNTEWTAVLA